MASQSVARSEPIAPFIPDLELLITEAMDEWKIPGLTVAVVQNGEVAPPARETLADPHHRRGRHQHLNYELCELASPSSRQGRV
jgi:CubicO group peptidase (beta-lactamase class C family)